MEKKEVRVVVLAAGKGVRMQSEMPKALQEVDGRPMIKYLLEAVERSGIDPRPVIVVGHGKEKIISALGDKYEYAVQEEQLGTGHALLAAKPSVGQNSGIVLVLSADQPLLSKETLQGIVAKHQEKKPAITMATVLVPDFEDWRAGLYRHFSRIIRKADGSVEKIVEFKDATEAEKKVQELNPAVYAFAAAWLWQNIEKIKNDNAQGEYYLVDLIGMAREQNKRIETVPLHNILEALQPNSKEELTILEKIVQNNPLLPRGV